MDAVLNKMNNNRKETVGGVVVLCVIIYLVYRWYLKQSGQPFLIKQHRRGDYITHKSGGNIIKLDPYAHFPNSVLPPPLYGNGYSYSIWLNLDNWEYNYDKPKHIFSKGDRAGVSVNPGVWLYPKENNLMIRVDTFGRSNNQQKTQSGLTCQPWASQYPHAHTFTPENYPEDDLESNYCRNPDNKATGDWCYTTSKQTKWETCGINSNIPPSMSPYNANASFTKETKCDLVNIPLQRWNNLVLVLNNKTLDVYLNGKLARSCTYEEPPIFNQNPVHVTDNGGFGGELGELRYFNRAIDPEEVYSIYAAGNKTFNIYSMISKITPSVHVSVSASVSATVSKKP